MNHTIYPNQPPCEPPKPTALDMEKHNMDGLWMTHDPAIYHDPVSNNYYIYNTGKTLQPISENELLGNYERISLTPSVPQGIQCAHPFKLMEMVAWSAAPL